MSDKIDQLINEVSFDANGLVAAIAQDAETRDVLMMAYMNEHTLRLTLETGRMTYWSRSRQKVWVKGESSGNVQKLVNVRIDCDGDVLLFAINQQGGAACHTGYRSCFYRALTDEGLQIQSRRVFDPGDVYGR